MITIKTAKKQKLKENKGITLIALVITIIVLLILAGVTIATLTGDNGILTKTNNAKAQTDEAAEREAIGITYNGAIAETKGGSVTAEGLNSQFSINGTKATATANGDKIKIDFETGRSYTINAYGTVEKYIDIAQYIKVGDYINYNPTVTTKDGQTAVEASKLTYTSQVGTATEHGNGNSAQTFTATANTKWRVLNINSDGTVELISENIIQTSATTPSNFILQGARGYLYAEQELNEVCKIFGYGYGADTSKGANYTVGGPADTPITGKIEGTGARSITIEDINKQAGITEADFTTLSSSYGNTTNQFVDIFYPTVDTTKGNSTTGISTKAGVKNIKYTWYSYTKSKIVDTNIQNMLFNGNYWLASRCFGTIYSDSGFSVSYVNGVSASGGDRLCYGDSSKLNENTLSRYSVRPVINLKSDIIDVETSSEYNGFKMWNLK